MSAKRQTYEYLATQPDLPPGATSPMMDSRQMTDWMNHMASQGWEFVGYGQKWWHNRDTPQDWWIFRKASGGGGKRDD